MDSPHAQRTTAQLFLGALLSVLSSSCSPAKVECAVHKDCSTYRVCSPEHLCVAPSKAECQTDADCPGEYCTRRGCAPAPVCEGSADCGEGYLCSWHECQLGCTEDSACGEGQLCLEGACTPACNAAGLCAEGELCIARQCLPPLSPERRFRVAEQGSVEITPPSGGAFTAAGSCRLDGLAFNDRVLTFTSTACKADAALIDSPAQLGDAEETVQSLIEVYDPGAPQAPILQLTDVPEEGAVQVAFAVPPENPSGGCATRDFKISWSADGSEPQTEEIHLDAPVGETVVRKLPIPWGEVADVTVTAVDELGAEAKGSAHAAITRAKVVEFALSANHGAPTESVELRYSAEGSRSLRLLRDGERVRYSDNAAGSWSLRVGAKDSVFSLEVTDMSGNVMIYPARLHLSVDATRQTGSGPTPAGDVSVGVLDSGESDVWLADMPYEGGYFEIETPVVCEDCDEHMFLELQDVEGNRIARVSGSSPSMGLKQANNLAKGQYRIVIGPDTSMTVAYAISVRSHEASCGNGAVETRAGEACESSFCTDTCQPASTWEPPRTPTGTSYWLEEPWMFKTFQVPGTRSFRARIHLEETGWVDIGTGNYLTGECDGDSEISIENLDFSVIQALDGGGPGACARLIRRLEAGDYYAHIQMHDDVQAYNVNYAVNTWGRCGDYIVNPLAGERCDGYAGCDEYCNLESDVSTQSPWTITGSFQMVSTRPETHEVYSTYEATDSSDASGTRWKYRVYDRYGTMLGHCANCSGLTVRPEEPVNILVRIYGLGGRGGRGTATLLER